MKKGLIKAAFVSLAIASVVAPLWGDRVDSRIENKTHKNSTEVGNVINSVVEVEAGQGLTVKEGATEPATEHSEETDSSDGVNIEYIQKFVKVTSLNIRKEPNVNSDKVGELHFNQVVCVSNVSEEWAMLEDGNGFVCTKYLSDTKLSEKVYDMPYTNGFKSYMPHNTFSHNSNQYKLQKLCHTGNYGIRQYSDRYCVALGSYFGTEIGQYFDIVLENGTVIPCVMADQKADCHTDSYNRITSANGCVTEFIVDLSALNSTAKTMGDISHCNDAWKCRVVNIVVYDTKVDLR